ncbi:MAG: hypothetical protein LKG17_07605 [Megasphaera sp.]|jgi:hypothetical protein|nr:hypothetical protein [Megasphaera sp.]
MKPVDIDNKMLPELSAVQFKKAVLHEIRCQSGIGLIMVAIYKNPTDFPQTSMPTYVARAWVVKPAGVYAYIHLQYVTQEYETIKDAIPAGMYRVNRSTHDDPHVLETYI